MDDNLKRTAQEILNLLNTSAVKGFWLHFDTDVIDDKENAAVDYRTPGGLRFEECEYLMRAFLNSGKVIGISVGIYNPNLDKNGITGKKLVSLLIRLFS